MLVEKKSYSKSLLNVFDGVLLLNELDSIISIIQKQLVAQYDNDGYSLVFDYHTESDHPHYLVDLNGQVLYIGTDFTDALKAYYNTLSNHYKDRSQSFDPQLGVLRDILVNQGKWVSDLINRLQGEGIEKQDEIYDVRDEHSYVDLRFIKEKLQEAIEDKSFNEEKKRDLLITTNKLENLLQINKHNEVEYGESYVATDDELHKDHANVYGGAVNENLQLYPDKKITQDKESNKTGKAEAVEEKDKHGHFTGTDPKIRREQSVITSDRSPASSVDRESQAFGTAAIPGQRGNLDYIVRSLDTTFVCHLDKLLSLGYLIKDIRFYDPKDGSLDFTDENSVYSAQFDGHTLVSVFKQDGNGGAVLTTATSFTPTYGKVKKDTLNKQGLSTVPMPQPIESIVPAAPTAPVQASSLPLKSEDKGKISEEQKPIENKHDSVPETLLGSIDNKHIIEEEKPSDYKNRDNYYALSKSIDKFYVDDLSKFVGFGLLTKGNLDRVKSGKPMVVYGVASYEIVDREGHLITCDALKPALQKFLANPKYRNAQLFHSGIQIGEVLPQFVDENGRIWKTEVIDGKGMYAVVQIRTDMDVAIKVMEEIEKGNLRSFSISGNAKEKHLKCDGNKCWQEISSMEMYELTFCLLLDSLVTTEKGDKRIQEITTNDYVLTHKSHFKKVQKILERYINENVYRVWSNDYCLNITREHPILIFKNKKVEWVKVSSLLIGDELINLSFPHDVEDPPKITKIEMFPYVGKVYNLIVEEDNSYCFGPFSLHNCSDGVNPMAKFDIIQHPDSSVCPNCDRYQGIEFK